MYFIHMFVSDLSVFVTLQWYTYSNILAEKILRKFCDWAIKLSIKRRVSRQIMKKLPLLNPFSALSSPFAPDDFVDVLPSARPINCKKMPDTCSDDKR